MATALMAVTSAMAVGASGLLAGCASGTAAGSATPGADIAPGRPYPPQQIPLAGLDPCTLLAPDQRGSLGVYAGVPGPRDGALGNAATCEFRWSDNTPGAEYRVAVASGTGIEVLADPTGAQPSRSVTVGGFPALDITSAQSTARGCTTAVNVSAGQLFEVSLELPPPRMDRKGSCAATERVATAVLLTVRAAEQK